HCAINARRGKSVPVRGPGYCCHPIGMTTVGYHGSSCSDIIHTPHLNGLVIAGRSEKLPVRGPGHSGHCVRMASIGKETFACSGVPDLDGSVETGGSDELTVGRPR